MRKYSTEFKLEVVQSFLTGNGGTKPQALRWSLPKGEYPALVSHCRQHGLDGLRPKRSARSVQRLMTVLQA